MIILIIIIKITNKTNYIYIIFNNLRDNIYHTIIGIMMKGREEVLTGTSGKNTILEKRAGGKIYTPD